MQTRLPQTLRNTEQGAEAEEILRKCVHCGFCNATCPTYQVLGDELDGPRGRIYLIKQMLEGHATTAQTQLHLDRCLTCRNCETTCPSGVQFGRLLETGRRQLALQTPRPLAARAARRALAAFLHQPTLFSTALRLGQFMQPVLPAAVSEKIPPRAQSGGKWPTRVHPDKVLALTGCVQPAMSPGINLATAQVLDALGVQMVMANHAGCCGAIPLHLGFDEDALIDARRNIDAWWPWVEQGVKAIVMNASGCGVTVKDYGHLLRQDTRYAAKAERIAELTVDISEFLEGYIDRLHRLIKPLGTRTVAFHPPCTLQHGQQIRGKVEAILSVLGITVKLPQNAHLCCGSAGTYSILQSELSKTLRDKKCEALSQLGAQCVVSANIGCICHLQTGISIPVMHWVELVAQLLGTAREIESS
ncbi:glycolate oxidase subunit GlcF [Silvimonas soli]|uniref:glycolate oxidase subunit GlcF n=1 Tax=Silvimonas soli TaxID=2980100 RepID=UPI0024B3B92D|nr:glycolate oxidase subunit GlcF [Silvimonas soli]